MRTNVCKSLWGFPKAILPPGGLRHLLSKEQKQNKTKQDKGQDWVCEQTYHSATPKRHWEN